MLSPTDIFNAISWEIMQSIKHIGWTAHPSDVGGNRTDWEVYRTVGEVYMGRRKLRNVVAVHVRRDDITSSYACRWVGIEYYCKVLEQVRDVNPAIPIEVYTDGSVEDIEPLMKYRIGLCAGGDPVRTMENLVNAAVLVTSKSMFCTVAAYASHGLKLSIGFPPHWCDFESNSDICPVSDGGDFDGDVLARRISGGFVI